MYYTASWTPFPPPSFLWNLEQFFTSFYDVSKVCLFSGMSWHFFFMMDFIDPDTGRTPCPHYDKVGLSGIETVELPVDSTRKSL